MINEGQNPRRKKAAARGSDLDRGLNLRDLLSKEYSIGESEWEDDEPGNKSGGEEPGPVGAQDLVRRLIIDFRLFCQGSRPDEQIEVLGRMQQQVKAFRSLLANSDLALWAKFSGVLSTLLFATAQKPGFPSASAFRTMADALDLLRTVVSSGSGWRGSDPAPITVLAAADDPSCSRALHLALQNQGMKVTVCESAEEALNQLRDNPFDVIFLDTCLPEMDNFVLSSKLRRLPFHATTPILLLTSLPDFGTRFEWVLDDDCDFIAKPIVPSEAAVKAFAFGLKFRLDPDGAPKVSSRPKALPAPPQPAPAVTVTPPEVPKPTAKELAEEAQRRSRAEEQAAQLAQARALLEEQLAARALQVQQVQEQAAELEKTRQSLNTELGKSSRRETRLKQECDSLEQQMASLNKSLDRLGRDLAQENERRLTAEQQIGALNQNFERLSQDLTREREHRLKTEQHAGALQQNLERLNRELARENEGRRAAEQQAGELARDLSEAARAESAARQQLGQLSRDHAKELARAQSALQKETRAREQAEQAGAELSAAQSHLEKQLTDAWLQVQQVAERHLALHQAQKLIQTELRGTLDRHIHLQQQLAAADQPLKTLSEILRPAAG